MSRYKSVRVKWKVATCLLICVSSFKPASVGQWQIVDTFLHQETHTYNWDCWIRALYEHFTWQCLVLKIKHKVKISFTPDFLRTFYNSIWDFIFLFFFFYIFIKSQVISFLNLIINAMIFFFGSLKIIRFIYTVVNI